MKTKTAALAEVAQEARTVPWMDAHLYSNVWPLLRNRDLAVVRFSFHQELGDGFRLSDPSHAHWRETMVEAIAAYAADCGLAKRDGMAVYSLARKFVRLYKWLQATGTPLSVVDSTVAFEYAKYLVESLEGRTASYSRDDCDVDEQDVDDASDSESDEAETSERTLITSESLRALLHPLVILWQFRTRLPTSISDDPFPDGTGAVAKALDLKKGEGELAPLASGCHLLYGAIRMLSGVGPLAAVAYRNRRSSDREARAQNFAALNAKISELGFDLAVVTKKHAGAAQPNHVTLESLVSDVLPHAYMVLVGTMSLARPVEVMGLKSNCISGGEHGGYWQTRRIAKGLRQDRGAPVPAIVVTATALMRELFEHRRGKLGTDHLLPKRPTEQAPSARLIAFTGAGLDRLARIVRVPPEGDGTTSTVWHFTPKQFRGLGAAAWVYRFDLPVAALSVFMFHNDWGITGYYLQDKPIRKWCAEYQRRFSLDMVEKAASGAAGFAGLQSKRLSRLVSRLRVTLQVSVGEAAKRVARALVDDLNIIVSANAWGYCFAPPGQRSERRAQCMRQGIGRKQPDGRIDSTASKASICCGCRFFGSSASRLPYMQRELSKTEERARSGRTPEERALERDRAQVLRGVIEDVQRGRQPVFIAPRAEP